MARLSKVLFAATLIAAPATVFAEDPPADGTATPDGGGGGDGTAGGAPAGGDGTAPPAGDGSMAPADGAMPAPASLTLGKGKIVIGGETATINMSADAVGKPIALAPSIWYGVSDKLTVGLTHDGGTTKFTPRPGLSLQAISILGVSVLAGKAGGICLTGEENGCAKVYDNVSLDALFSVKAGKFSLAAHPALDIGSFDPFLLSLRIGALGTYAASDKITIAFDPRIKIGITERDFNKESIDVPVWVWYHLNEKMGVAVNTGIAGPLDGFGDAFVVPVGLNFSHQVNEKLGVGADFSFVNLLGKGGEADFRALGLRASYAL